jgi:ADP-ribosyl-[dinitrogen reductase] hydrolase
MHNTQLRRDSIQGLLIGVAIGDALGFPREGLKRRVALRMFGGTPLAYRLLPGTGIYSDDTQLMLMAAQAVLRSNSTWRIFRQSYLHRLAWYPLSLPVGAGRGTICAAFKSWLRNVGLPTGCHSAGNGPATRAIFLTLALHGTEHRAAKWVEDSTRLTHDDPLAVDGCLVLSKLAQIAATSKGKQFDPIAILQQLVATSKEPILRDKLSELTDFLNSARSPRAVARHFGWQAGISGFIVPTTVISCYCFLRYPTNYRRAVETSILLGGDTDSVGAIVGGLVGAHVGYSSLPPKLVSGLLQIPHGGAWIEKMSDRLAHWPHGAEDLHAAPALPSEPAMQLIRNLFVMVLVFIHIVLRIPCRLFTRSASRSHSR